MQVAITPPDELETTSNAFAAKEELAELTKTLQDIDYSTSPIEAAALQLTMRQVDKSMDLPSTESYNNNPSFFVTLAHEGLKENLGKTWKKFIEVLRSLVKSANDFCFKILTKIKGMFSKKKAEPAKEADTDTMKTHTVQKNLAAIDGEVSLDSILKRVDGAAKLANLGVTISVPFSFMNVLAMAMARDYEQEFKDRQRHVLEKIQEAFPTKQKGTEYIADIGDGVTLQTNPDMDVSYPTLVIEDLGTAEVEVSGDNTKNYPHYNKHVPDLIKALDRLLAEIRSSSDDIEKIQKHDNETFQDRIIRFAPLLTKRLANIRKIFSYSEKVCEMIQRIV